MTPLRWLRKSYSVLFLLVLWEAVSRGGLVNPYFLPSATAVAGRLWGMLLTGGLAVDLGATVLRVLLAFGVAAGLGIPLGIAMGRLRTVRWLADPFVSVGFPMPKVSFLPIFILWFGYDLSKILLTTVAAVFPIVAATHAGVAGVDRSLLWVGQNLKMREGRIFLRIVLPAILPQIFNGLQIAFPVGLIVVVVTEMLTGGRGVGTVMMMGARFGDSPAVFAGLVLVAALGLASLKGLATIRARLLRWHQETRAAEMAAA